MKKLFLLLVIACGISAHSFAQTSTREKIEQAASNSKAKENAAKADILLIDKKNPVDSSQFSTIAPIKKKKSCIHRKKKKSNSSGK